MKTDAPKRFGLFVRWMLWRAGWKPSAAHFLPRAELPNLPLFAAAEKVLSEFFGLVVGSSGQGKHCARVQLSLDPRVLHGLEGELELICQKMGTKLYPLGEVDGGHAILVIAETGSIYMWFDEPLLLVADSFEDALQRMLLGLRYAGMEFTSDRTPPPPTAPRV